MSIQMIELQQGTQDWLEHRTRHYNASDAAAALGLSRYKTRQQLMREKATGFVPDVDEATQRRFDKGHEFEAIARPWAEEIIGAELFPIVLAGKVDGLPLSASLDGLTMLEDVAFEHKTGRADLLDSLESGVIPDEYKPQMEQCLLLSGATKCLFMASSGNREAMRFAWYESDPVVRKNLLAGWKQFAEDLAAYEHVPETVKPVAAEIESLPALMVQVEGKVLSTNLDTFKSKALAFIGNIKTELVNDQDFADADKMVKFLKDGEDRLALAKSQALAQTSSIDELFRTIDAISGEMKTKRIALDKLVKAEKENRRAEIVSEAADAIIQHVKRLNERLGANWMPGSIMTSARFAEAIKGLKSLDSMRDKVAGALAQAKIEANEIADRIEFNANQITVDGANYNYLVHDFAQICTKPTEDFAAIMSQRIAAHKAAEAVKIEAAKKAEDARIAAAVEAERVRAAAEAAKLTANNQTQFEDQRGKANAGITMPACEQTTAAPDAGLVPVDGPAGNAASAASTPPIQQSDIGQSLDGTAGKSVRADHFAGVGNMVDDEAIDDFIRLLSIGAVEKKALKVNIQKWERYRVARLMQAAA